MKTKTVYINVASYFNNTTCQEAMKLWFEEVFVLLRCLNYLCWWRRIGSTEYKRCRKIIGNIGKPLFSEKRGDQIQDLINRFETLLTKDKVKKVQASKNYELFCKIK